METVWIKETSPGVWRVTFDGVVLGDSRGYRKDQALAEAAAIVLREHGWAERDGRKPERRLGNDSDDGSATKPAALEPGTHVEIFPGCVAMVLGSPDDVPAMVDMIAQATGE